MAHPAGKELRNSSTATENSLIEPTVLLQNIQFTQEENSKAEHLRPRFPLFQNSVPPIGLQSFWRCFVHLALKNSTFKTGLSKNILKPEKIPSQIRETRAWSCLCQNTWHLLWEIFCAGRQGKANMLNTKESACKHLPHKVAINATR